jgi:hypothetical protein
MGRGTVARVAAIGESQMKAKDALIVWTPVWRTGYAATHGKVRVGPLLKEGDADWTRYPVEYASSGGAGYIARRKMRPSQLLAMVFIDFHSMVVRDGIDPQEAHRAFLTIDEYRTHISPDIAGADA